MKIYISGAISSIPLTEALRLFGEAENYLKSLGHEVINPMTHNHDHGRTWAEYIIEDLTLLMTTGCDAIYMLKNWKQSPGATLEIHAAISMNLNIVFEDPCTAPIYVSLSHKDLSDPNQPQSITEPIIMFISHYHNVTSPQHPQAPYESPSTLIAASGTSHPQAKNEK